MSSDAVSFPILQERAEEASPQGRATMAVDIFQSFMVIPVLALIVLGVWLATDWDILVALVVGDVLFLAFVPFVWRYSRVVWLHLDWLIDPVPASR